MVAELVALYFGELDANPSSLVYMQRQRYGVERSIQDAKNEGGIGDYQAGAGMPVITTWRSS